MSIEPRSFVPAPRIDVGVVDVLVLASVPGAGHSWQVLTLRRAAGVRCTGAWEIVHGRIEPDELPSAAACRELQEETGLVPTALYSLTVNPFYLHQINTVEMAVGFVAIVDGTVPVQMGEEHDAWEWRDPEAAMTILAWPRTHEAIRQAMHLLRNGDAGAVDDVLRVF